MPRHHPLLPLVQPDCRVWHFLPRSSMRKATVIRFQLSKIIFRCRKIFLNKAQVCFGWGALWCRRVPCLGQWHVLAKLVSLYGVYTVYDRGLIMWWMWTCVIVKYSLLNSGPRYADSGLRYAGIFNLLLSQLRQCHTLQSGAPVHCTRF